MSVQYISDNKGQTTGVFIPIQDWKVLKNKFKGLDTEKLEIPSWQLQEIDKRVADYKKDPSKALDFNQAMDDIESEL